MRDFDHRPRSARHILVPVAKGCAALAACLAVSLVGLAGGVAAASPPEGRPVAGVFPPWWSQSQTLTAASSAGPVLAAGASRTVWVVAADRPGLAARLRAAGALLLLDPASWQGCLAAPSKGASTQPLSAGTSDAH